LSPSTTDPTAPDAAVLEINVDAVGTCGFELFCKIGRAMIDTGIKAELFGYEPALLGTAGDSTYGLAVRDIDDASCQDREGEALGPHCSQSR